MSQEQPPGTTGPPQGGPQPFPTSGFRSAPPPMSMPMGRSMPMPGTECCGTVQYSAVRYGWWLLFTLWGSRQPLDLQNRKHVLCVLCLRTKVSGLGSLAYAKPSLRALVKPRGICHCSFIPLLDSTRCPLCNNVPLPLSFVPPALHISPVCFSQACLHSRQGTPEADRGLSQCTPLRQACALCSSRQEGVPRAACRAAYRGYWAPPTRATGRFLQGGFPPCRACHVAWASIWGPLTQGFLVGRAFLAVRLSWLMTRHLTP